MEQKNRARESALALSREVIRHSANAIRSIHRGEVQSAQELLALARSAADKMKETATPYGDLYWAGYVQDALKEFAEASLTVALIREDPLPEPEELGVEYPAYLNGLGEAVGELRRHILDKLREGDVLEAEKKLDQADDIYYQLFTFDFPEAVTGGLRRTVDAVRSLLERTRGDVTNAVRQLRLETALETWSQKLMDADRSY